MAAPVTSNATLHPQDGWVLLSSNAPTAFLRVEYFPKHIPVHLAWGSSPPSLAGTAGTGTVTFSTGVPTAGQTVTIGSETYTFAATRTVPFTVAIGGTNLITATNFTAAVQSDSALVSASDTSGVVTLTSKVKTVGGNFALTTNATNVAVSGAALTGGANPNVGFRIPCGGTHFDGAITGNTYARIASNSNGEVVIYAFSN
jgi:hypothetical protein